MSWFIGTAATLTSFAGIAGLFYRWQMPSPKQRGLRRLGWALLIISAGLWIWAQPVEFGVTFALVVPALLAWLVIMVKAPPRREARPSSPERLGFRWPAPGALGKHIALFILTVPFAGLVGILLSFTFTDWLPWEAVNRLVMGVFLTPVIWGAASYWLTADTRLWRPLAALTLSGLLAALYLFL